MEGKSKLEVRIKKKEMSGDTVNSLRYRTDIFLNALNKLINVFDINILFNKIRIILLKLENDND